MIVNYTLWTYTNFLKLWNCYFVMTYILFISSFLELWSIMLQNYKRIRDACLFWNGWHFFYFKGIGDTNLAYQCFRLTLASNNDHAEAYNNLGVLEMRRGHVELVCKNITKYNNGLNIWMKLIDQINEQSF